MKDCILARTLTIHVLGIIAWAAMGIEGDVAAAEPSQATITIDAPSFQGSVQEKGMLQYDASILRQVAVLWSLLLRFKRRFQVHALLERRLRQKGGLPNQVSERN